MARLKAYTSVITNTSVITLITGSSWLWVEAIIETILKEREKSLVLSKISLVWQC